MRNAIKIHITTVELSCNSSLHSPLSTRSFLLLSEIRSDSVPATKVPSGQDQTQGPRRAVRGDAHLTATLELHSGVRYTEEKDISGTRCFQVVHDFGRIFLRYERRHGHRCRQHKTSVFMKKGKCYAVDRWNLQRERARKRIWQYSAVYCTT
jgi:hypothetical protein